MSTTSRGSLALAGGEAIARLIAFGTTVYLARVLGPDGYGVVAVATGIMLYLSQLTDQGVELVGIQEASAGTERVGSLLRALVTHRLRFAAVLIALAAGLWYARPTPDTALLALLALGLPLAAFSLRWVYVGLHQPVVVSLARIVGDVITAGAVLLLIRDPDHVLRYPLAVLLGLGAATGMMFRRFSSLGVSWRNQVAAPDVDAVIRRGRQLAMFTLLGLVLYNVDLLILRTLKGEASAGQYAAAYVLISFCANLVVAWAHTVLPFIAREPITLTSSPTYAQALSTAWAATIPIAVGGILVADPLLPMLFGDAYRPAAAVLQVLLLSVPVAALRETATVALIARQRESALLRANAIATVANVSLNLALIPRYGLTGAAVATVLSEFLRLLIVLGEADQTTHATRVTVPLLLSTLAAGVMGIAVVLTRGISPFVAIGVGVVTYAVALMAIGFLRFGPGLRVQWTPLGKH